MIFNAFGKKGHWIKMLQDFNFKILHHHAFKLYYNVDTLNYNLVGKAKLTKTFKNKSWHRIVKGVKHSNID
jgi:hypothetical protein